MLLLFAAAGLCLLSLAGFARGLAGGGRIIFVGFDGVGVICAFVVTVFAGLFFGPLNGLSLVLALMLHEAGHLLGSRLCGRTEATFRLLPAFGGLVPDDRPFTHDCDRFFHALMGAGISIAPMLLAVAAGLQLRDQAPGLAAFLRAFALSVAVVNAVNLLPFRALDGGRCVAIVARVLSPVVVALAVAGAIVALAFCGTLTGATGLVALTSAGMMLVFLHRPRLESTKPMTPGEAQLGFLAYLGTLGAHLAGGLAVIQAF
jgi:hypothetical protein